MARAKKIGATKRTYRLSDELINRIETIAESEKRTVTAQIEIFLEDKVRHYERKTEDTPAPSDRRAA